MHSPYCATVTSVFSISKPGTVSYYAWKSRSIWGGVLLHGLVAVSMDTLAHIQKETGLF